MATGDTVKTARVGLYHVEIKHPGRDWNHIHPVAWETTDDVDTARAYADLVEADRPGSDVRIIEARRVEVTKLIGGEASVLDLGTMVLDR